MEKKHLQTNHEVEIFNALIDDIFVSLNNELKNESNVTLEKIPHKSSGINNRDFDLQIITAVIAAGSAGVGALITGIFNVIREKKARKLILKSKEGSTIEAPISRDMSPEEVLAFLEKLDSELISITIK